MSHFSKKSPHRAAFIIFTLALTLLLMPSVSSAAHVRVAVMPWTVNGPEEVAYLAPALTDMISSRVGSNEMVEIVRKDLTAKAAGKYNMKIFTAKKAVRLAKTLNADFIIYGSVSVLGDAVSLDAKLVNAGSGLSTTLYSTGIGVASIVKMSQTISNDALAGLRASGTSLKPDLSYTGKFKTEIKEADNVIKVKAKLTSGTVIEEPADIIKSHVNGENAAEPVVVITRQIGSKTLKRRSTNIDGFFVSMTRADLDGDGLEEVFMISKDKLLIASFTIDGLKIIKEFKFPNEVQNLSLSSGDSDHDGKDEVYIARLVRGGSSTVSVRYLKGSYSMGEPVGLNRLLSATEVEGEGTVLLAQDFNFKSGFFRKIIKVKKDGDKYSEDSKLSLPKSVARMGVSNFRFIDIDSDGTNEIVTIGKDSSLRVYKAEANSRYKEYWRSSETYGGSLNELEKPEPIGDEVSATDESFYMASEIKYGDYDLDGVKEIMLKTNVAGGLGKLSKKVMSYKSGSISRLSWNVAMYEELWKTKDISGYVADFIIADLDGDGTKEVTMLIVENIGGMLKRAKAHSYLLSYSIR